MKALTIYPRTDLERVAMEANVAGGRLALAGLWALPGFTGPSKKFSDAELAAEYWVTHWASEFAALNGFYSVSDEYSRKAEILHRFATLPHALGES